ncbi:MAG: hypothetical protein N2444_08275, partial [Methylocystis sp.]|nr:hypothetical protein [Methylocystis sp.]
MRAVRPLLALAVIYGGPALADAAKPPEALFELKVDIDRDGKIGRAVLVGGPGGDHNVVMDGDVKRLAVAESPDLCIAKRKNRRGREIYGVRAPPEPFRVDSPARPPLKQMTDCRKVFLGVKECCAQQ